MSNKDLAYGVFDGDEHEGAGRAVTMRLFVGSSWAVAAILAWVVSDVVVSGGLDEATRGAASWVLACLAGGVLQQLWFNFRPASYFGYGGCVAGLDVSYFVTLSGCALLGKWLLAWTGFAGIYLAILAVLTVVFTVAFRRKRAEYQEVLDRFHDGRR